MVGLTYNLSEAQITFDSLDIKIEVVNDSLFKEGPFLDDPMTTMASFNIPYDSILKIIYYKFHLIQNGQVCEGKTFAKLNVEKDGSVSDYQIIRGPGKECDSLLLEVLKQLPPLIPGKDPQGNPIRQILIMPIKLDE